MHHSNSIYSADPIPPRRHPRGGYALIWCSVLLATLVGIVGLVVDGGMVMSTYRQARNAADAAALAAAMDLFRGRTFATAEATAVTFVQNHNALVGATVTVNNPPQNGPYSSGDDASNYVEVIVEHDVNLYFIHVMPGINPTTTVRARAVAGSEARAEGEGAIVLDPNARPGLNVTGGATLRVDGSVIVNSRASGNDQYGTWLDTGYQQYAASSSNNTAVEARYIQVAGGVDWVDNFKNYDPGGPNPLFAGAQIQPDPLRDLPIPDGTNGANLTLRGEVKVDNNSPKPTYLNPGIYEDILITQGAEAIFNPGIYILSPSKPQQGLRINGSATVTGNGVLFYATGSNYMDNGAGYYDSLDGHIDGPLPPTNGPDTLPPPPDPNFNQVKFATVDINATDASVTFTGIDDPNSPFHNILFFQRRRNMNDAQIQGNAGQNVTLGGAIYAKWARFKLAGEGRYDATFVVGSMQVSGQAIVTINGTGDGYGIANQVFLVE